MGSGAAGAISIVDTAGTTMTMTLNNGISTSTAGVIAGNGASTAAAIAQRFAQAVNLHTGNVTASPADGSTATITLTQDTGGTAGNRTNTNPVGNTKVTLTNFTGGDNAHGGNYGLIIKLSGSQEVYHSGSNIVHDGGAYTSLPAADADPNLSSLNNLTGSDDSFYTKKFFARSSQYFFKTPRLEARWDSSIRDDSANFYVSSALAPELDNVNTIYLYNYVRGQLQNIPTIGDSLIYVSLHTGSSPSNLDPVACEIKHHTPGGEPLLPSRLLRLAAGSILESIRHPLSLQAH